MGEIPEHLKKYVFKKGDDRARKAADKANDVLFDKYLKDKTEPQPIKKLAKQDKQARKAKVKRDRKKRIVLYQANRMASPQDKTYARLLAEGTMSKTKAYIQAYDVVLPPKKSPDYKIEREKVRQRAVAKTKSEKIARLVADSEAKIDEIYVDSLETLHDLVKNGRSEKVRAEVGIEFVRQKRGAPTTKVKQEGNQGVIVITVGEKPQVKQFDNQYIEGEVVMGDNGGVDVQ